MENEAHVASSMCVNTLVLDYSSMLRGRTKHWKAPRFPVYTETAFPFFFRRRRCTHI